MVEFILLALDGNKPNSLGFDPDFLVSIISSVYYSATQACERRFFEPSGSGAVLNMPVAIYTSVDV